MERYNHTLKYSALIIGAILMAFSGLNWHIGIAAWFAPVFLLYYTRQSKFLGFLFFFIFISVSGAVSQTGNNLFNIPVITIINGLSYGFAFTLVYFSERLLYQKGKGFYSTLIFPSVMVLFEFLISSMVGTWGIIAHTQFLFKPIVQLSTITGLFGITFLVCWFSSVLNWIFENKFNRSSIFKSLIIFGLIFLSIVLYGFIRISGNSTDSETVKVAAVISETDIHRIASEEDSGLKELSENPSKEIPERVFADKVLIKEQISNTITAAKEGSKIIVWNEISLILDRQQVDSLTEIIIEIAKTYRTYILTAYLEKADTFEIKPFNNKSVLISSEGKIVWEYLKSNLHPYAEVPIINRGNDSIPFIDTEYGRIGNVICYDMDFTKLLQQTGKNSIDIMLVPSYDWEGITPLHANMAVFEAVQNGFSLIRSNGKGLNVICDDQGNILAKLNSLESDSKILYANIPIGTSSTIYSNIGHIFVFIVFLFFLMSIVLRIRSDS